MLIRTGQVEETGDSATYNSSSEQQLSVPAPGATLRHLVQLFLHIGSIPFSSAEDEERLSRMECGEVKLAGICLIGNVSQHQPAINL